MRGPFECWTAKVPKLSKHCIVPHVPSGIQTKNIHVNGLPTNIQVFNQEGCSVNPCMSMHEEKMNRATVDPDSRRTENNIFRAAISSARDDEILKPYIVYVYLFFFAWGTLLGPDVFLDQDYSNSRAYFWFIHCIAGPISIRGAGRGGVKAHEGDFMPNNMSAFRPLRNFPNTNLITKLVSYVEVLVISQTAVVCLHEMARREKRENGIAIVIDCVALRVLCCLRIPVSLRIHIILDSVFPLICCSGALLAVPCCALFITNSIIDYWSLVSTEPVDRLVHKSREVLLWPNGSLLWSGTLYWSILKFIY